MDFDFLVPPSPSLALGMSAAVSSDPNWQDQQIEQTNENELRARVHPGLSENPDDLDDYETVMAVFVKAKK